MKIRCAFCPAAEPNALAALAHGWTARMLTRPVTYRSAFGDLPPTPAGEHHLCPVCTEWLTDHRDRMLPPAVLAGITDTVDGAGLHPRTARRLRLELVGIVRHLADALTEAA